MPAEHEPDLDAVAAGRLVSDLGIYDPDGLWSGDRTRLALSAGTRAAGGLGLTSYRDRAFVPRGPWRSAGNEELLALLAGQPPITIGSHVTLVRAPDDVLTQFAPLRKFARGPTAIHGLPDWLHEHPCAEGREAMLEFARTFVSSEQPGVEGAAIVYKAPGLRTATTDGTGEHVGLHIDNWYGAPLAEREHVPNRVSINLGPEPRFFLFINLRLETLAALVTTGFPDDPDTRETQHGVRRAFMSHFSSYPVVRLRLDPGEGYIAPTENMIHDASTEARSTPDVQFTVRGRFWPG
jgi:hypothetical protein